MNKDDNNAMKRYVTGCKHFQYPMLETEYNSFASQSNEIEHKIASLQKEARVCVSNAFVIEDSKFKWCFLFWKISK